MRATALLLSVVLVPFSAAAQEVAVAGTFEELNRRSTLEEGNRIRFRFAYRHLGDEIEMQGKVVSLTDSAIVVRVDQLPIGVTDLYFVEERNSARIEIPESRVQQIEVARHGDSVLDGFLIGGAVGAGSLSLMAVGTTGFDDDLLLFAAVGFLIGAPIGVAADLSLAGKNEVVYVAHRTVAGSGSGLSMSPIVTKRRKGLLFTLSW